MKYTLTLMAVLFFSVTSLAQTAQTQQFYFQNDGTLYGKWFKILTISGGGLYSSIGFVGEAYTFDDWNATAQKMTIMASVHDKNAQQKIFHTWNGALMRSLRWVQTASTGDYTGTLELWGQIGYAWQNSGVYFDWKYNNDAGYTLTWNSGEQTATATAPTGNGSYWVFDSGASFNDSGKMGIGTISPDERLTVAGKIHAQEVKVTATAGADFVFDESYQLKPLAEVAQYVKENKHLPEIASAEEMKTNGIELGEMNIKLLQKVEELTLYLVEQQKQLKEQQARLEHQQTEINTLRALVTTKVKP